MARRADSNLVLAAGYPQQMATPCVIPPAILADAAAVKRCVKPRPSRAAAFAASSGGGAVSNLRVFSTIAIKRIFFVLCRTGVDKNFSSTAARLWRTAQKGDLEDAGGHQSHGNLSGGGKLCAAIRAPLGELRYFTVSGGAVEADWGSSLSESIDPGLVLSCGNPCGIQRELGLGTSIPVFGRRHKKTGGSAVRDYPVLDWRPMFGRTIARWRGSQMSIGDGRGYAVWGLCGARRCGPGFTPWWARERRRSRDLWWGVERKPASIGMVAQRDISR